MLCRWQSCKVGCGSSAHLPKTWERSTAARPSSELSCAAHWHVPLSFLGSLQLHKRLLDNSPDVVVILRRCMTFRDWYGGDQSVAAIEEEAIKSYQVSPASGIS
jgi:hypothetical protein